MTLKTIPVLILFLLAVTLTGAEPIPITGDELLFTKGVSSSVEDAEYVITPEPYNHFSVSLTGSEGYTPSITIFDTTAEMAIAQFNAPEGGTVSFNYTAGEDKREPRTYTILFNIFGKPGASYTFNYKETPQDDAGTGGDATRDFKKALLLTPGEYAGFLGDQDTIDYYAMELVGGEEIAYTLQMPGKGTLRFTLIDGDYSTRIDQKTHIDENQIIAHYASGKAQTVWIGVEGNTPYALIIGSNKQKEPEPVIAIAVEEPEEDDKEPAPVPTTYQWTEEDESSGSRTTGIIILVVAVVLLVALAAFTTFRKKELKKEEAGEEGEKKPAKKKAKKK